MTAAYLCSAWLRADAIRGSVLKVLHQERNPDEVQAARAALALNDAVAAKCSSRLRAQFKPANQPTFQA